MTEQTATTQIVTGKLKVFISWSGLLSKASALALYEEVPNLLQNVEPFMSDQDIDAGALPMNEIFEQLRSTEVGIICVTRENAEKVWINFEAGAIGKTVTAGNARVISLMLDFPRVQDLRGPLANFQNVLRDEPGVFKMCASINKACANPLPDERFRVVFDRWWPAVKERLDGAVNDHAGVPVAPRPSEDMIPEILTLVRELSKRSEAAPRPRESLAARLLREAPGLNVESNTTRLSPASLIVLTERFREVVARLAGGRDWVLNSVGPVSNGGTINLVISAPGSTDDEKSSLTSALSETANPFGVFVGSVTWAS